jgi:protein-serine/threonine kinase
MGETNPESKHLPLQAGTDNGLENAERDAMRGDSDAGTASGAVPLVVESGPTGEIFSSTLSFAGQTEGTENMTALASESSIPVFHVRTPSNVLVTSTHARPSSNRGSKRFDFGSTQSSTEDLTALGGGGVLIPGGGATPLRASLSTLSLSQQSISPGSAISSPALAAMTDITPLPSPLIPEDSPNPWRSGGNRRSGSVGSLRSVKEGVKAEDFAPEAVKTRSRASSRKGIGLSSSFVSESGSVASSSAGGAEPRRSERHTRHRSLSEQVTEPLHNVRPRTITLSAVEDVNMDNPLHREVYLAEQRGLVNQSQASQSKTTQVTPAIPTPPPSNRSTTESEGEEPVNMVAPNQAAASSSSDQDLFVRDTQSGRKTKYRIVRPLGQGTFSKVVLATSEHLSYSGPIDHITESKLDKKQLVAIKIVDHGPAGGADEERVELSLRREIEIMQSVKHPSLIHLMAFDVKGNSPDGQALLVLNYCAGGDLFDLAAGHRDAFESPELTQRIFAELASAVGYLHMKWIVHRDIKLESRFPLYSVHVRSANCERRLGQFISS